MIRDFPNTATGGRKEVKAAMLRARASAGRSRTSAQIARWLGPVRALQGASSGPTLDSAHACLGRTPAQAGAIFKHDGAAGASYIVPTPWAVLTDDGSGPGSITEARLREIYVDEGGYPQSTIVALNDHSTPDLVMALLYIPGIGGQFFVDAPDDGFSMITGTFEGFDLADLPAGYSSGASDTRAAVDNVLSTLVSEGDAASSGGRYTLTAQGLRDARAHPNPPYAAAG